MTDNPVYAVTQVVGTSDKGVGDAIHAACHPDGPGGAEITQNERMEIARKVRRAQADYDDIIAALQSVPPAAGDLSLCGD